MARRSGDDASWQHDGWSVHATEDALVVETAGDDREAGLRTVVAAAWAWYDDHVADAGEASLDIQQAVQALRLR